ncbi:MULTISPECIES: ABC transporter permease [Neorhizobium]|jgi:peptide/nickel transport system permease protein|uniref:Dipeptide transport system permease protein n=1 Tax=Neorhizobium galegae bv. officinalis TaxID=323656 RepID=A0A0T7GKU5_NEOGA|nr:MULTISPECIES: ABC transporter permease [Neorhizobium]CDZ47919.1 Dipeptide transport system permease protein [Neorhizobium galegae bv. officinalis]
MTILPGSVGTLSASDDIEHAIAPEPGRTALLKDMLFGQASTIFAFSVVVIFLLVAILAPWLAPYDPLAQSILSINKQPSWAHWLGTDQFGRDVLSRMIHGSRNSLLFGLISPALAAFFGTILGVTAGYFGGVIDRVISRVVDLLLAFPELLLAIMIAAVLGGAFWNIIAVITVAFIPGFARVARASTLAVKQEPYIEAAVAVGLRTPTIIIRHVIPNIAAPILVLMTLWVASAIRLEASLSFLGIGTRAPNPSWGNIIRDGLNNLFGSPWPIIAAGFAITCVVLSFNLMGDAVRDVLDPETTR